MSTFEARFAIHHHIVPFLNGPTLVALIATHRDFRVHLASFVASFREMIKIEKPEDQLMFAAEIGSLELCELMRPWCLISMISGPSRIIIIPLRPRLTIPRLSGWDYMLHGAARGHDWKRARKLCEIARSWGATDWNGMLSEAAFYGNRDICEFARSWCHDLPPSAATEVIVNIPGFAHAVDDHFDYQRMLCSAASGGHRELCELARSWSRANTHSYLALHSAVQGGSRETCELLYSWILAELRSNNQPAIIPNLTNWLGYAAFSGHRNICELVRSWALIPPEQTLDWNTMYKEAVRGNHPELCELARSWGSSL